MVALAALRCKSHRSSTKHCTFARLDNDHRWVCVDDMAHGRNAASPLSSDTAQLMTRALRSTMPESSNSLMEENCQLNEAWSTYVFEIAFCGLEHIRHVLHRVVKAALLADGPFEDQ